MKFLDPEDRFFRQAWVRWATTLAPLGWSLVEFLYLGSPFWGLIFLAAGVYAGWTLLLKRSGG
jgi:hypothetical protein